MKRRRAKQLCICLIIGSAAIALSILPGCDYGRMYDQDVIKTFKKELPDMDKRTIPVGDSFNILATTNPDKLKNPLQYSRNIVGRGRVTYSYYCVQCHGERLDGQGTVGQSFTPLPRDLTSLTVLSQSDGLLYSKIRLGFKRHPALFSTLAADDSWAVVVYMRSFKPPARQQGGPKEVTPAASLSNGASVPEENP